VISVGMSGHGHRFQPAQAPELAVGCAKPVEDHGPNERLDIDLAAAGAQRRGKGGIDPARSDPDNALGAPDGKFVSLGLGGELILTFGSSFTGPATLWEVTGGDRSKHFEEVELYGGFNSVWTFLGTISNSVGMNNLFFAQTFNQLKLIDISPTFSNRDGFDVDSVSVSMIPVPAAGLLLITALGVVGAVRRRKV
jgi:hypothetical protein